MSAPYTDEDDGGKCSRSTGGVAPALGCAGADVSAGGVSAVSDCVPDPPTSWQRVTASVDLPAIDSRGRINSGSGHGPSRISEITE